MLVQGPACNHPLQPMLQLLLCRIGVNRIQFLLESLADLDAGLRARGSRLLVLHGNPTEVWTLAVAAC